MTIQLSSRLLRTACEALGQQLIEAGNARPLAAYAIVVFEVNGVQEVRIASACTKPCTVDLDELRKALATIPSPAPEG
jgi:hypothetical protein